MVENCIIIANHCQSNFVQIAVGPITVLPVEIRTSIIMQIRTQKNKTKKIKKLKKIKKKTAEMTCISNISHHDHE